MRILTLAAPVLVLLAAGCAPTAQGNRAYNDLQRLTDECTARGGIIAATGQQTGQPQLDNTCRIVGASRLPSGS
jgi:hypothetical protein